MSTNLHIIGVRDVTVNKTGEQSKQHISFNVYQTPTKVTRQLLASNDVIQAYKDWVNSYRAEYEDPVYHEDDIFEEGEPIGFVTVCNEDEHIKSLDEFLKRCENEGYTIECYSV